MFQTIIQTFVSNSFTPNVTFIDFSLSKISLTISMTAIKIHLILFTITSTDPNLDCGVSGSADQCGSENWLLSNASIRPFFKGTCQNGADFSSFSAETCQLCPAPAAISGCSCSPVSASTTGIHINCTGASLSDTQMAAMVQTIQPSFSSSIAQMTLKGNLLTKVPSGMTGFTRLVNPPTGRLPVHPNWLQRQWIHQIVHLRRSK